MQLVCIMGSSAAGQLVCIMGRLWQPGRAVGRWLPRGIAEASCGIADTAIVGGLLLHPTRKCTLRALSNPREQQARSRRAARAPAPIYEGALVSIMIY
jgi:hypothetical protein